MSDSKKNRVLSRIGAHELNQEQTKAVIGGMLTVPSVIITGHSPHFDMQTDS